MTTTGQKYNITIDKISHQFNNRFDKIIFLYKNSLDIISADKYSSTLDTPNVFYAFLLRRFFLRLDNGAVWLSLIATNSFATQATAPPKQTNPLQSPTHKIGVLCTFFARVLDAPKRAPQAYGIFFVCLIININLHAQIKSPTSPTFNLLGLIPRSSASTLFL